MFLWVTLKKVKLCSWCNRARSYCCVPLLRPLLLSNRSHSAIGWQCSGPLPQAPSRHWVTLVRDAANGWGSGGRPVENELWGRSWPSPWGLQLTGPWASRWAGGAQGTGWGCAPQGSGGLLRATHWPVRVLRQRWTSSPSLSLQHTGPSAWVSLWDLLPTLHHRLGSLRSLRAS